MYEEKACDLEVKLILQKQHQNDLIKSFLTEFINSKQQDNNNYNDLQLLADVSFYYQKVKTTINITNDILETTSKILKLNPLNKDKKIDEFLDLSWKQIKEETIKDINNIEEINNLTNNYLLNNDYQQQKFLK